MTRSTVPTKATKNAETGKSLLIVESPSKVKTIAGYLGDAYELDIFESRGQPRMNAA